MNHVLQIHATSVVLKAAMRPFGGPEGVAVVLIGRPGAGKSDLALRLIAAGADLLADDLTRLTSDGERLFAEAGPNMAGFMEVRHVGIVRLGHAARAPVALVAELDPEGSYPRLPEPAHYKPPAPLSARKAPAFIRLNPFEASAPAKIAVAASAAFQAHSVADVAPQKTL